MRSTPSTTTARTASRACSSPRGTGRQTTYAQWLDYNYRLHHDNALPAPEDAQPLAPTFINHGRWLWLCPACLTAVQVSETAGAVDLCCCPACFSQGFVQPAFPADRAAIEAELMRQPGYRWNAPFRNWEPGWTLAYLQQRTAAAQAQIDAGATYVRAASIGTPRTWSVGEVLTAANMNTYIREIQRDLIGTNGPVEFLNALVAASMTTAERNALTAAHGMILFNSTLGKLENYDGAMENAAALSPIAAVSHGRHHDRDAQPGRQAGKLPSRNRACKRLGVKWLRAGRSSIYSTKRTTP